MADTQIIRRNFIIDNTIPFSMYSGLIKSKQTFLLVYTTVFTYLISSYPNPSFMTIFTLTIGMITAVAGSTLLNMYIDRDIDAKMDRTKDRAIPSGKIRAKVVLYHGIFFSVLGIVFVGFFNNLLTMFVIATGLFFDVVVYSIWLKRRTKWSIIFGGIAGGLPAMAGRTAVINSIDATAILFLLFVLLWIPLHILTLATLPKAFEGYKEAGVPMWPVVSGIDETVRVITIAAFLDGIILIITGSLINLHLLAQIPLFIFGLIMITLSIKNFRNPNTKITFKLFKFASMFMGMTFLWMYIGTVITQKFLV